MPAPVSTHDSRRATQVTLKAVTLLSGVLTVVFLVSFFFSDRGIAELQQARRRVDDLHADIQKLQAENSRLRAEIESAKNSTYAVEKIAREDLALSRKGEVIYMLPPTNVIPSAAEREESGRGMPHAQIPRRLRGSE